MSYLLVVLLLSRVSVLLPSRSRRKGMRTTHPRRSNPFHAHRALPLRYGVGERARGTYPFPDFSCGLGLESGGGGPLPLGGVIVR